MSVPQWIAKVLFGFPAKRCFSFVQVVFPKEVMVCLYAVSWKLVSREERTDAASKTLVLTCTKGFFFVFVFIKSSIFKYFGTGLFFLLFFLCSSLGSRTPVNFLRESRSSCLLLAFELPVPRLRTACSSLRNCLLRFSPLGADSLSAYGKLAVRLLRTLRFQASLISLPSPLLRPW